MSKKQPKIPQWEKEKKANLIEAFTRVLRGEPADGGNSEEDTRAYLIEFQEEIVAQISEKVDRALHRHVAYLEIVLGYTVGDETALKILQELEKVGKKMKNK